MTGTPLAIFQRRMGSERNSDTPSTLLPTVLAHGLAMDVARDATSFRDFHSAWCTSCAGTRWKSSLWLTVDADPATGEREPDHALRTSESARRTRACVREL